MKELKSLFKVIFYFFFTNLLTKSTLFDNLADKIPGAFIDLSCQATSLLIIFLNKFSLSLLANKAP